MSYVLESMPPTDAEIHVLDPRGRSQRPILSVLPLARAWVTLLALGLARRVDVAHINMSSHGSSIRKPIMLWTCRMLRIPVILHLHASEYPEFFSTLPSLAKRFLRRTFAAADVVLVLGSHYRDYVCNDLAVPAHKVKVLLNGSPGPDSAPMRTCRSEPLKILFLGRLGERKGVPELIAALADHRLRAVQWLATLAGDGDVAHYRAQARALGLGEHVRFPGWVSTPEANQLLRESDVLVLPSRAEGLPMSVIEAFAYGVPVVSTAVGAIGDVVEHGFNGLLIPVGGSTALADALLMLLEDDSLRRRLGRNARRTWENELDIASYARKLTSYWQTTSTATVRHLANASQPSSTAAPHAPSRPAVERPTVIYVMGSGRSGSTILGVALGNCDNVFYAGELEAWLRRSGVPNFSGDRRADFWRLIRHTVAGEDLYGEATWRYIDYSLAPLNPRGWLARRRMRRRYREITERLYQAVAATAGSTHVVDTSHYPLRARELRRLSSIDAYVIYLVRRPQDVVASFSRRDVTNSAKSTLAANAYLYLTHLLSIFAFMRHPRDRRMLLRYEDLIAAPEQSLDHILTWSRCSSSTPRDLSSLDTGIAFQGNRLLESSTIDLRRRPRAAPSRRRGTLTAVLQCPWRLVHSRLRPVPPDAQPDRHCDCSQMLPGWPGH